MNIIILTSEDLTTITDWKVVDVGQYNHKLSEALLFTPEQLGKIREYVDSSGILQKLNNQNIPYGKTPETPLGQFSFKESLTSFFTISV